MTTIADLRAEHRATGCTGGCATCLALVRLAYLLASLDNTRHPLTPGVAGFYRGTERKQ